MDLKYLNISALKILFLAFFVFILGCSYDPPSNEKLVKALNDTSIVMRGKIIDDPQSEYRYDYYDGYEKDSYVIKLSKQGYQGGGPTWAGIVYGAILLSDKKLLSVIRFDEEAEGLAIWSKDKESLMKIGRLIAKVKTDDKLLADCIETAKKNGRME